MLVVRTRHTSRSVSILGILVIAILIAGGVLIYRAVTRPLEDRLSARNAKLATPQSTLERYLVVREEFKRAEGSIEEVLRGMSRDDIKWFMENYSYISYFSLGGKTTGISQVLSNIQRQREALKQLIRYGPQGEPTKILSITEKGERAIAVGRDVIEGDVTITFPIFLVKEGRNWKIKDFFGARQQRWQIRVVEVKRKANEALSFEEMQFEKEGIARYLQESLAF
jgi:hypothetical protein